MPEPREIDVAHVARLARLDLTAEEIELFEKQLGDVLEYAEKLRQPDTTGIPESGERNMTFDTSRDDEPRDWFTAEEALRNAPREKNDLFVVPKVVE
jgi:aspartyl-tRNA(Asn)/glutamyl-tRNA(Gln) amidotransferase subunit C